MPSEKTSWEAEGLDPVAFMLQLDAMRSLHCMAVWSWPCCAHKADFQWLAHLVFYRADCTSAAFQLVQHLCSQQLVLYKCCYRQLYVATGS